MISIKCLLLPLLLASCVCLFGCSEAKTVFRRTDKISEHFKQLDLPPEEIDPNVAPEPQKVPTIDPEDVIGSASTAPETANNELSIDESANEIASADAAPAAPVASSVEAAAPVTAAPAAATTAVAKPQKKPTKPEDDKNPISRYCKCSDSHCDCCRKFGLPLLPSGPGCAKISYLGNDEMSVSIKYGDITLASRRISSKKARPICVGLPGGYSKFCGRVYGLSRAKENFKACLAFELRAEDEVEAALRVSCFKFGPEGLRVAEAEPLPSETNKDPEEDDDDDDIFGFAAGGGDDEEEDDYADADTDTDDDDDTDDYAEADDDAEAPEEADYGGFSLGGLLDELEDDDDEKPAKKPAVAATTAAVAAAAAVTPAVDQTREHADLQQKSVEQLAQGKDEAGIAASAAAPAATAAVEQAQTSAAVESEVTTAPAAADATATTTSSATPAKSKKSKKTKKNKKKKAAAEAGDTESDFAYELFNGILDFFN